MRDEDKEEQEKIHDEIVKVYGELGYKAVSVPFMSVKDRVKFIIDKIR